MAELVIKEHQIGDVTVLDLDGMIRIGEGSVALRNAIRRLITEGKRNVVLDLAGVGYIDSSGVGELVTNYTILAKDNGMLRLANITEKLHDLLTITKLLTVYDVYDNIEEAVKSFDREDSYLRCPVHGCANLILFAGLQPRLGGTCKKCGTHFRLRPLSPDGNLVSIVSLHLGTYENEYIDVAPDLRTTIRIVGRLDLFASEVLERAWLTVPPPRRILFHLTMPHEITPAGMQKLLSLCAGKESDSKGVIVVWPRDTTHFPHGAPIYLDQESAIKALGEIANVGVWELDLLPASTR